MDQLTSTKHYFNLNDELTSELIAALGFKYSKNANLINGAKSFLSLFSNNGSA